MRVSLKDSNTTIDECSSTNDIARKLAELGCPSGTWISAKAQLSGRGRTGNQWVNSNGNLYLSVVLRDIAPGNLTWIPLATAFAAVAALKQLRETQEIAERIRIKWPNDLYLSDRKVGGILCESFHNPPIVVSGVGINIGSTPDPVSETASSVFSTAKPSDPSAAHVLERLRPLIAHELSRLSNELSSRKDGLKSLYEKISYFKPGDPVYWGKERLSGKVLDLGPLAELRVLTANGDTVSLYSEDVFHVRKTQ